ncbi:MAG: NADH-quinone oxidoreductase subunit M [Rhodospirillaceae bacterium]|jgi:NADH-quinone oxidoreductase subunit M|nr:NADH-quinone oxidoreductase subunit M [Rhodospirillaceae bacterium]MDP6925572.1 NADH-quinone oxidoreductase subunit M [Rhodospirillales bacterium]|tara:strand:- start:1617 stop:3131 length:1515 start_codon:yes stop_codon:yes gene_type:complete
MANFPWLSVITFAPLVGVFFILLIRGDEEIVVRNARWVALWVSLITFFVSIGIWINFDNSTAAFQFEEKAVWMPGLGLAYHMGIDGISMFFVLLSTLLTVLCVGASWITITDRVKEYMIAFLVLETLMVGMFSALDLILFYVFFEGVLIPMFLIIGVWGGPRRNYAAYKLFLYTLAGSVLMLLAILVMVVQSGTADIPTLLKHNFPVGLQPWLWLAFFASFAVKVPMWPVHTWLPDAHVEAPTAGSVILAGVLLKFGGYGFLRFSLPMFPLASADFTPLIYGLSIVAVIYTSLVALAQEDMKKLIAYSSVAHMGFVTIGTFAANVQGIEGAIIQMLSHGVVSAALFLVVGVVYDRMHSRDIETYGGLVHRMPAYAVFFMIFMLASVGLPGTSGFVGEFLILVGAFKANSWVAFFAATGLILGAAYMLYLYRRVIFGELTKDNLKSILDISPREIAIFAPLLAIVFVMGIYPAPFLDVMHVSVANLVQQYQSALAAAQNVIVVTK